MVLKRFHSGDATKKVTRQWYQSSSKTSSHSSFAKFESV